MHKTVDELRRVPDLAAACVEEVKVAVMLAPRHQDLKMCDAKHSGRDSLTPSE